MKPSIKEEILEYLRRSEEIQADILIGCVRTYDHNNETELIDEFYRQVKAKAERMLEYSNAIKEVEALF